MKILVAGATGVVGRLLVPKLVQSGHEVVGMTRRPELKGRVEAMGARAVVTDVFDRAKIISTLAEVRPEVVIHQLTSLSQRDFSENSRIRVEGTRNLVDAALAVGVQRIIAQSIAWAYQPGEVPASEGVALDTDAPLPRKGLVNSIDVLERTVTAIPQHVILRYGLFYGPGTFYHHDGFVAEEIRQGRFPAPHEVSSFVHIEDAAQAALLALDWPSGPVNIVDDEPARANAWLPVYARALGVPESDFAHSSVSSSDSEAFRVPDTVGVPEALPLESNWARGASNTKARHQYGWQPSYPTWRTGFLQTLASPTQ